MNTLRGGDRHWRREMKVSKFVNEREACGKVNME